MIQKILESCFITGYLCIITGLIIALIVVLVTGKKK